jgi:hypothetical protein
MVSRQSDDPRTDIDRYPPIMGRYNTRTPSGMYPLMPGQQRPGARPTAYPTNMNGFPDLSGIGGGLLDVLSRLPPGVLASMAGAPPKHLEEEPSSTFHWMSDTTPHETYTGVNQELRNVASQIGGGLRNVLGWPFTPDQQTRSPQPQPFPTPAIDPRKVGSSTPPGLFDLRREPEGPFTNRQPSYPSGQPPRVFERSPVPQPYQTFGDDSVVSKSVAGDVTSRKEGAEEMRTAKEAALAAETTNKAIADAMANTNLSQDFIGAFKNSAQEAFQTGKLDLEFLLEGEPISSADLYTVVQSMTDLITDFRSQQMELSKVYTGGDPTQETYLEREMTEREVQGKADRIAQGLDYQLGYQQQQENVRSAKKQEEIARQQIAAAGTRATEQQKNDLKIAENRTASEEKVQTALEAGRMTRFTGEKTLAERTLTEQERAAKAQETFMGDELTEQERAALISEGFTKRQLDEMERAALKEEGFREEEIKEQKRAALIDEGFSLRQIQEIERAAQKEEGFRGREVTEMEERTKIAEDAQAETTRAAKAEESQAQAELTAAGTMATAENQNRLDVATARVEGEEEVAEIQTAANKLMHANEISERQADRTVENSRIANEKKIALKTIKSTEGIDEARRELETSLQQMQDTRAEKERELQSALNTANISQAELRRLSDVSDEANRLSEQVLERELRESLGLAELTETRLVREQKLQIAQLEDTLARDLQNVGINEAQIDRILQFELAVMEQQTQLMQAQLANPYAAAVMQQMAGGVSPFAQGLGELGVGIPGISTEQTGLEDIFPGGIPTIGALSQADPETLNYLNALLGFSGITPEQFGMAASEVTPQAGQAAFGRAGQRPGRFISRI